MKLTVDNGKLFFDGQEVQPEKVTSALDSFVSERRKERIAEVLGGRSTAIATVVEGSVNTGNVSAVMRTAEAFGFLPFHVIRTGGRFKNSSRSSQGSEKWLDLHYWDDPVSCLHSLKDSGYQIVATSLGTDAVPISDVDFSIPTAIIMGNEAEGVSESVLKASDVVCQIPMSGFVESFNVSVAAALCLYHAWNEREGSIHEQKRLTDEELRLWRCIYYYRSVRRADDVIARLLESSQLS